MDNNGHVQRVLGNPSQRGWEHLIFLVGHIHIYVWMKLNLSSHDTRDNFGDNGIPTFRQHNPEAYKAMNSAYINYIKFVSSMQNGTVPPAKETSFSAADLQYSNSGLPRVPAAIKNNNGIETNLTQQQIIRVYLTRHYSTLYSVIIFMLLITLKIWLRGGMAQFHTKLLGIIGRTLLMKTIFRVTLDCKIHPDIRLMTQIRF